jgi:hypothetical protein
MSINRNQMFLMARMAQKHCSRANAVEPFNPDLYDKWNNIRTSFLSILYGAENVDFATDFLMDNVDFPLTLAEMDDFMAACD